ncbi:hypothetical protein GCM10009588_03690 [Microbacterium phyllosphaerae]
MVWSNLFGRVRLAYAGADVPSFEPTPSIGQTGSPRNKEVAFRILFDEYWARIRRHIACFVDNAEEIDELTAEVFVVAWKKLDPAKPMGLTWFLRVADNKLRDAGRRRLSRARVLEALTRGLTHSSNGLHPLEVLALRQALKNLNARERQVIVLTYWDGLTAGEISEVLRCSQGSVWTTLTRARTKLREQLELKGAEA